jgi:hypothetical protein
MSREYDLSVGLRAAWERNNTYLGKANGYGGMRHTQCCDEGFYKEYNTIIPGDDVVVTVLGLLWS